MRIQAPSYPEMLSTLAFRFKIRAPFEPFRDVLRNGEDSTLELVARTALAPEGRLRGHGIGSQGQLDTCLPNRKLLRALATQCAPPESGILNLDS